MRLLLALCILLTLTGCAGIETGHQWDPAASPPPAKLQPTARIDSDKINESSGIIRSRNYDDVYWTHNDSGDAARIYAIRRDGTQIVPEWTRRVGFDYQGVAIGGAVNIDWEDIASDADGNLYIGAFGNNANARRDLGIYVLPEPNPFEAVQARPLKLISFRWEDQTAFPPEQRNFDCEAMVVFDGEVYLLTKHRSDANTKLYRLESQDPNYQNIARLIGTFPLTGPVTAADISADGRRLAVLAIGAVYIFEGKPGHWFSGSVTHLPVAIGQCEAITFIDPETLMMTNEGRDIFEVQTDSLVPLPFSI